MRDKSSRCVFKKGNARMRMKRLNNSGQAQLCRPAYNFNQEVFGVCYVSIQWRDEAKI